MKNQIEAEITINSTPQTVWRHLIDFEEYPRWNPFIPYISGNLQEHQRLKVTIKPDNSKPMMFTPTIIKVDEYRELRWLGKLFIRGLFDGEHYFRLTQKGDKTILVQGEVFSGILVRFFNNMIENKTLKGFQHMNEELKKRIESSF